MSLAMSDVCSRIAALGLPDAEFAHLPAGIEQLLCPVLQQTLFRHGAEQYTPSWTATLSVGTKRPELRRGEAA